MVKIMPTPDTHAKAWGVPRALTRARAIGIIEHAVAPNCSPHAVKATGFRAGRLYVNKKGVCMEFKVQRRPRPNTEKFSKEHFDTAYKFAEKAYKEFGTFIKCIVLFGSATRQQVPEGDIDILIVIDDLGIELRPEVVQTYRIITQKLIADISSSLHVTTLKLTSFWEYVKAGDPVAINILRDGVALVDTGMFDPLQMLLRQGRIRPTPEAVWSYFVRAPATIQNSKWHVLQACVDLYWAVVDAAHAALMRIGEVPPSPQHVAALMDDTLVKRRMIDKKYPLMMQNFFMLMKKITHREIKEIRGIDYDRYCKDAEDFINEMKRIVESRIEPKRPSAMKSE